MPEFGSGIGFKKLARSHGVALSHESFMYFYSFWQVGSSALC